MKSKECYEFILEEIKLKKIDFEKHIDYCKKYYKYKDFGTFYASHLAYIVFGGNKICDMYDYFGINDDNLITYIKKALKTLGVNYD